MTWKPPLPLSHCLNQALAEGTGPAFRTVSLLVERTIRSWAPLKPLARGLRMSTEIQISMALSCLLFMYPNGGCLDAYCVPAIVLGLRESERIKEAYKWTSYLTLVTPIKERRGGELDISRGSGKLPQGIHAWAMICRKARRWPGRGVRIGGGQKQWRQLWQKGLKVLLRFWQPVWLEQREQGSLLQDSPGGAWAGRPWERFVDFIVRIMGNYWSALSREVRSDLHFFKFIRWQCG